jgi:hypothetical protein
MKTYNTRAWHSLRATISAAATVVLFTGTACASASPTMPVFGPDDHSILFVGNSLTYTNDLPGMVITLARMVGDSKLQAASVANPNFALEDHWHQGQVPALLRERRWQHVVMQQGSSALPASQEHLKYWTERFAPLVRESGAEPVLLGVWPQQNRPFDFPNVAMSYTNAAAAVNGLYAPAGDAWTRYGDYNALYSDGLHPSPRGTYLAALVVLQRVRGIRPDQLPPRIPGTNISEADVRRLQQAAMESLAQNPARPGRLETPAALLNR